MLSFLVGLFFICSIFLSYVFKTNATTGALGHKSKFMLEVSFSCYYLITFAVNVAYVIEAYKYFRPLYLHIRHPGSVLSKEHVQKIQRVVFYVFVSIISTFIVTFFLMLWAINRLRHPEPLWAFAVNLGSVQYLRCLTNYTLLKAITPSTGLGVIHILRRLLKGQRGHVISQDPAQNIQNFSSNTIIQNSEDLTQLVRRIRNISNPHAAQILAICNDSPENKQLAECCLIQEGSQQRYWSNRRKSPSSSRGLSRSYSSRSSLPSINEEKPEETKKESEEDATQKQAEEV